MFVSNVKDIERMVVNAPGAAEVVKQSLIGPAQGWQGWVMRLFTLGSGGHTPRHTHPWPHINYAVSGTGVLYLDGKEYELQPGAVAYIPSGAEHQFINRSGEEFAIICIVPEEGDK